MIIVIILGEGYNAKELLLKQTSSIQRIRRNGERGFFKALSMNTV
jgi:hypothetical protein